MRLREGDTIIGADPSNTSFGVGVLDHRGSYLSSFAYNPWVVWDVDVLGHLLPRRIFVFFEVPANGTHASRGGVQRAAGMFLGGLVGFYGCKRRHVYGVKPYEWRKTIFGRAKATKEDALEMVENRYGFRPETHDEAEAILIAQHGYETLQKGTK